MKISVIVSTYSWNRYEDLIELLDSLCQQTCRDMEIVIIIDENTEMYHSVKDFVESQHLSAAKVILNPENRGLSYSRNVGILNSTGDIVSFIDDDAIAFPAWAETIVSAFDDENVGAATGDIIPIWERQEMSWFPRELHWMISCSYSGMPDCRSEVERGFGTNMAFRRDLIDKIGLFNTALGINGRNWIGGEDTDMFLKIREAGKKVIYDPDAKVWHKINARRTSYSNIIKRALNGGISVAVMKNARSYSIKNSTEDRYLRRLLFEFYPGTFKCLIKRPSLIHLKRMMTVSAVIFFEGVGYLYGSIKA